MQDINDIITGMDTNITWRVKKINVKKPKIVVDKPQKK